MQVCLCSMAGTKACENCSNNNDFDVLKDIQKPPTYQEWFGPYKDPQQIDYEKLARELLKQVKEK